MAGDRLDDLMLRVKAIQGRVAAAPALRWGTVTATSPLSVLLDGAPDAFVGVSNAGPRALVVGQRVRVDVQGTRVTVVSAARDDLRGTSADRVALGLSGVMQDGMKFYDTDENREYAWGGGEWKLIDSGAYANLPGSPNNATVGSDGVQYQVKAGWVSILADLNGSFGGGTATYWTGVPDWLAPGGSALRFGAAYLGSTAATAFIRPDGTMGFVNPQSTTYTRCRFTLSYPI